ncbi:peroxisomal acyl-CoA-dehydrogenase [Pholiota molesta]|nr:peroxisomal acyl-CoA-dehydrogenase [Pholiota molesta]
MASKELKTYTREEVAKHNKDGDLWIVIDAKVYDITRFKNLHPGGASVLLDEEIAGQDATEAFYGLHRHDIIVKPQYARLQIGIIEGEQSVIEGRIVGELSKVPYGEPTWLTQGYHSPYYTENHRAFQKAIRKFMDEVVTPDALAREEDGKPPSKSVIEAMAKVNLHAMRMGPGKHLKGLELMGGIVKPEQFDYFHELIITQEFARTGRRGYGDGLMAGSVIGLPPVLNFGSPDIKAKVVPEVLSGQKPICLAISEAFAGSDVSGLKTFAKKTEDGKHWIINGTKKWITNGTFAHYFTVGCKTEDGFTVILVERGEGVETKAIKTSYSPTAGTAFVTFDNVKVPIENTLGPEGSGIFVMLRQIYSNFNHERWVMICSSARSQRFIVEECLKWTTQRKAFGKPLHSQAVIRSKLASMIARVESVQSWLENLTYQMNNMSYKEQASKLAGPLGILKMQATRSAQLTATDAVQIFGGRGITKTGMGEYIEHYHRTVPFDAILGGAEDVLGDLGVRQAVRGMPKNVRM